MLGARARLHNTGYLTDSVLSLRTQRCFSTTAALTSARQSFQILEENPDGFLEYYWSNPVKTDDRVADASGNPIRGLSPGTSVKLGYFLTTNFRGGTQTNFVIGSGIYPEDQEYYVPESGVCQDIPDYLTETARQHLDKFPKAPEQEEDDGGCTIASGNQGNLKVAGV